MVHTTKLCFLYFIINSIGTVILVSMRDWSKNDVIIDINKGYTLQRLGLYSPNLVEEVIHTFVPISRFCITSPQTDICQYASAPTDRNMALLTTMMSSNSIIHRFTSYNSENVSRLIGKDMIRVLAEHHPDNIIRHTKSIIHFVSNKFFYNKTVVDTFTTTTPGSTIESKPIISRVRSDLIDKFLKQISSNINKVGLEFLSSDDLKIFLAAAFSTIDSYYTVSNTQESLDTFFQYVVGQSIFALRYCSLVQDNSLPSQPCIAISTLFLRIQPDTSLTYSIYRLTALPIVHNNDMYVYTNLPQVIGIDHIDRRVITWKEDVDIKQCIFSRIALCKKSPISKSLAKSSCLSQLLDNTQTTTDMCQVTRSTDIEQDFMQIDNELWLFFNIHRAEQCHIYSNSNDHTESISINEPALVNIPCNKSVQCIDTQMPITSCTPHRTLVTASQISNSKTQPRIFLPIKNIIKMIVSSYESQFGKTINELIDIVSSKKPSIKQILQMGLTYTLTAISLLLIVLFLYLFKLVKLKFQQDTKYLKSSVHKILSL
ncbi:unnamed protein product [Rotaria socialis]|uniref:Uncharacterized protein n=3 Tax=Rotaria socialis TaxID=392032 RepID=A0A818CN73_9BILA|nr:unnamed protein product [Rotaria socialis]